MTPLTDTATLELSTEAELAAMPQGIDEVALARLNGEPLFAMPEDLYIPPDALEVFLKEFVGPLGLLLYLSRRQTSIFSKSRWPGPFPGVDRVQQRIVAVWRMPSAIPSARPTLLC